MLWGTVLTLCRPAYARFTQWFVTLRNLVVITISYNLQAAVDGKVSRACLFAPLAHTSQVFVGGITAQTSREDILAFFSQVSEVIPSHEPHNSLARVHSLAAS